MVHSDLLQFTADSQEKSTRASEKSPNALRTISEAAELVDVPQHVLRFWETKFAQIKPLKRNGGRRFYRPTDIETLQQIKLLLYKQGYTIKGAKKAIDDLAVKRGAESNVVQDWSEAFPPANMNDNAEPATVTVETPMAVETAAPTVVSVATGRKPDKAKLALLRSELISLREELAPFIERSNAA